MIGLPLTTYSVVTERTQKKSKATMFFKRRIKILETVKIQQKTHILPFCWIFKVHIFWEGRKVLRNLHLTFDWHYLHRTKERWGFRKILWPSQNIWTLTNYQKLQVLSFNFIYILIYFILFCRWNKKICPLAFNTLPYTCFLSAEPTFSPTPGLPSVCWCCSILPRPYFIPG